MAIPVLRTRPGVVFKTIAPAGFRILSALDQATQVLERDLMLTSGTDSHTTGRHPTGEAFDLSVAGLGISVIVRLKRFLETSLGESFTVLYEVPSTPTNKAEAAIAYVNAHATGKHIHIQPKRGTVYPPAVA